MLSSLMRLITLLSFAFVVPSAMAQFSATLSVDPDVDISSAEGIQVLNGSSTTVRATFGRVVTTRATFSVTSGRAVTTGTEFAASDIVAIAYNKLGGTEFAPWISAPIPYDSNDPYNLGGRIFGIRSSNDCYSKGCYSYSIRRKRFRWSEFRVHSESSGCWCCKSGFVLGGE